MCVFIPGWVVVPGIGIVIAIYLYIRRYILSMEDDRREAQLLALEANEWCQIAIERSSNKTELIDFFRDWISNGLLIDISPEGYEDTGYTKVGARRKIYVLMKIVRPFSTEADRMKYMRWMYEIRKDAAQ